MTLTPSATMVAISIGSIWYGPVADDRHDLVVVAEGELDAEGRRDLVAHAGERVLHVVLLGGRGPPQALEVAGHRAGGVDDDVLAVPSSSLSAPKTSVCAGSGGLVAVVALVDDALPVGVEVDRLLPVGVVDRPARRGARSSATRASRASARSIVAPCLAASKPRTLTLTNRTSAGREGGVARGREVRSSGCRCR